MRWPAIEHPAITAAASEAALWGNGGDTAAEKWPGIYHWYLPLVSSIPNAEAPRGCESIITFAAHGKKLSCIKHPVFRLIGETLLPPFAKAFIIRASIYDSSIWV